MATRYPTKQTRTRRPRAAPGGRAPGEPITHRVISVEVTLGAEAQRGPGNGCRRFVFAARLVDSRRCEARLWRMPRSAAATNLETRPIAAAS